MIEAFRNSYNQNFTEEKYRHFLDDLNHDAGYHIDFRIAETPLFIPAALREKIEAAGADIFRQVFSPAYMQKSDASIPHGLSVPGDPGFPSTVALDFAVTRDQSGMLFPKLIEAQAFPSLFAYQHWLSNMYRKHFTIPESPQHLLNGLDPGSFLGLLRRWILGRHEAANVILLEIEPEKQKTRVDFELTKQYIGIDYVCISKVIREGKKLYYEKDGKKVPIHRIYNRVIFDELLRRKDLASDFHLTEEVDVEWVSHPNWFFRISKFALPFINSPYVPHTRFLNEIGTIPPDLENYVLKPLFSFAGSGVVFDVTKEDIDRVSDPSNYILMEKVKYEPALRAVDGGGVKTEIRMLFLAPEKGDPLQPVISVIRLSRGKMIGVDYNKDKTWVGGSAGFFE